MTNINTINSLVRQGKWQVEHRIYYYPMTWPVAEPPYSGTYPTKGTPTDLTPVVMDWGVENDMDAPISQGTLQIQDDEFGTYRALIDVRDLVTIEERWHSDSYSTNWKKVATMLTGKIKRNTEGKWPVLNIELWSPIILLENRVYTGKLQPTRITVSRKQLGKDLDQDNTSYILYDGTNQSTRTINWDLTETPDLWINGEDDKISTGQGTITFSSDGLVRIDREWFDDKYGSGKEIDCAYKRFCIWEDTFGYPARELNSPEELVETMAKYGGFQSDDATALFYIAEQEPVLYADTPAAVWLSDISEGTYTDYTDSAIDDTSGDVPFAAANGDTLYVGSNYQRFCGLQVTLETVASDDLSCDIDYWNGSSWVNITPDIDTTEGFTQAVGFISWKNTDMSTWVRVNPGWKLPYAYYVRVRRVSATTTTTPVATTIVPAFSVQCSTDRYTYSDGKTPMDILEDVLRQVRLVPANYLWRCNEEGNLVVKHYVQTIPAQYELNTVTGVEATPNDADAYVRVIARGRNPDRLNIASPRNGCRVVYYDKTIGTSTYNWGEAPLRGKSTRPEYINDGTLRNYVGWYRDSDVMEGSDVVRFDLPINQDAANVYEIDVGVLDAEVLKSDAEIVWGAYYKDDATPDSEVANVHDGDLATYVDGNKMYRNLSIAAVFSTLPANLSKARIYFRLVENSGVKLRIEHRVSATDTWRLLKTQTITDTDLSSIVEDGRYITGYYDVTIDLSKVYEIRFTYDDVLSGRHAGDMVEIYFYEKAFTSSADTWDSNLSDIALAHDGDITTSVAMNERGDYIDITIDPASICHVARLYIQTSIPTKRSPLTIQVVEEDGVTAHDISAIYSGGSRWLEFDMPAYAISKLRLYLTATVYDVTDTKRLVELSEVEMYGGPSGVGTWSVYYNTTGGDANWQILCPEARNVSVSNRQTSIAKSQFGDGIYPRQIKLVGETMGKEGDGNYHSTLGEVRIWVNDTFTSIATYGTTSPYISAANAAFAQRMGWRTYVIPSVDEYSTTQLATNLLALKFLRELVRSFEDISVDGLRPEIMLGDTFTVPLDIQNALGLSHTDYVIEKISHQPGGKITATGVPYF